MCCSPRAQSRWRSGRHVDAEAGTSRGGGDARCLKCCAIYVPVDPQAPVGGRRSFSETPTTNPRARHVAPPACVTLLAIMSAMTSLRAILVVDAKGVELARSPVPTFGWDAVAPAAEPPVVDNAVDTIRRTCSTRRAQRERRRGC